MRFSLFLIIILGLQNAAFAQEKPGVAIEMGNSVTYSGYSVTAEAHLIHGNHNLYAGPRLNVSNTVMPANPIWGLSSGYRYILMDKGKVFASAWAVYENLDLSKVAAQGSFVHEIYAALAAGWRFHDDKLSVLTGLGLGGYIEQNKVLNNTQRNTGGWLRVSASYRLF
jgi:hypothetical protein